MKRKPAVAGCAAIALAAVLVSSVSGLASTITIGDQVSALYTSPVNGTIVTVNNSGNSETAYADPYNVTLTDTTQNLMLALEAMCFNADANIVPPNPWNGEVISASQLASDYFQGVLGKNSDTAAADASMIAYLDSVWGLGVAHGTMTAELAEEIGIAEWEVTADFAYNSNPVVAQSTLNLSAGTFQLGTSGSDTYSQTTLLNDLALTGPSGLLANAFASYQANTPISSYNELFLLPEQTGSYSPQVIQPFALLTTQPVPEPSSIVLLGVGIFGFGIITRRKRLQIQR
jgi:hypothetical protein